MQDPRRALPPQFEGYDKVQRHGLTLTAYDAIHVVAAAKAGTAEDPHRQYFTDKSLWTPNIEHAMALPAMALAEAVADWWNRVLPVDAYRCFVETFPRPVLPRKGPKLPDPDSQRRSPVFLLPRTERLTDHCGDHVVYYFLGRASRRARRQGARDNPNIRRNYFTDKGGWSTRIEQAARFPWPLAERVANWFTDHDTDAESANYECFVQPFPQ